MSSVTQLVRERLAHHLSETGEDEKSFLNGLKIKAGLDIPDGADIAGLSIAQLNHVLDVIDSRPVGDADAKDMTFGEYDYDRRMELYKVLVDSAERGIDRRHALNRFYFSVIVAIFVSVSFVLRTENVNFPSNAVVMIAMGLGFLNSNLWLATVFASKRLSASKYETISELERFFDFAPFTREWEIHLSKKRDFPRFTVIELLLPAFLAIVCLILFLLVTAGIIDLENT